MNRIESRISTPIAWGVAVLVAFAAVALSLTGLELSALAQGAAAVPTTFTRDPLSYFVDARYREAVQYSEMVIADAAAPTEMRKGAMLTLGTIRLAQGRKPDAAQCFLEILADDPVVELEQPERLPRPVAQLFYHLRDSICTAQLEPLLARRKLSIDIRTLAVGDMENNSLVKTSYDLDHFCRGLTHILMTDLQGATDLKLVDRQRLSLLLKELDLNKDPSAMDPSTRVRLGQLSGAQSYLFGQFVQVDRTTARMDLRWVNTSTGEILTSIGIDGKVATAADLFKFEKRILAEMTPQIQRMLDSTRTPSDLQRKIEKFMDKRRQSMPGGKSYLTYVQATGEALAKEEAGDLEGAAQAWGQAARVAGSDTGAKTRSRSLLSFQAAANQ